ncbi:transcriptional repressor [Candidatus Saccharibacteria bacterium]|nr:MAG: transcriptional repressor [Candidatus Saccharibacteria bacterium]
MQQRRSTRYTREIQDILQRMGHATNSQIAKELRKKFPTVSDTTVHRVTQRLYKDGVFALAPQARDGSVRYDHTLKQHDHFGCSRCDGLTNMDIPEKYYEALRSKLGACNITGPLTVYGDCQKCSAHATSTSQ